MKVLNIMLHLYNTEKHLYIPSTQSFIFSSTQSFILFSFLQESSLLILPAVLSLELMSNYNFYVGGLPTQSHNPQPGGPVNSLSDTISKYRDNWFNHITRMDHSRFQRYMLSYKATGKRSLGRPRKRWISQI
jgi:hypothetical protein